MDGVEEQMGYPNKDPKGSGEEYAGGEYPAAEEPDEQHQTEPKDFEANVDAIPTDAIRSIEGHSCIKIHRKGRQIVLAACDTSVIETHLRYNNVDIFLSRDFYLELIVPSKEIASLLSMVSSANLFGRDTIEAAIESGYTDPRHVVEIDGVPHVQIFFF